MSQIGLERGGFSIQKCREKFRGILDLLIGGASLVADDFIGIIKGIG